MTQMSFTVPVLDAQAVFVADLEGQATMGVDPAECTLFADSRRFVRIEGNVGFWDGYAYVLFATCGDEGHVSFQRVVFVNAEDVLASRQVLLVRRADAGSRDVPGILLTVDRSGARS